MAYIVAACGDSIDRWYTVYFGVKSGLSRVTSGLSRVKESIGVL